MKMAELSLATPLIAVVVVEFFFGNLALMLWKKI